MAKSKVTKSSVAAPESPAEYTVMARRYRPQQFADLIGQEHVATALVNALKSGRVAHAYLFTGARGVGKTSAARILAKALNCVKGPTATPCDECDSCLAIATGDDVDVHEIDGASNNSVENIRDLRQAAGTTPTRSRYKIYIIDEVHMLSTSAFNALLKTLEEPPPRVKFIFATTHVQKIPDTILSRCQRFDFAHVGPGRIFEQLKRIVEREGYKADDDALRMIARRAGGSMRDSQSLLDQLIASSDGTLTAEQVNAVLGAAGDERVTELAAAILGRDSKKAIELIAGWVERGLQIGEFIDQMVGYWRALMIINCGGPEVRDLPLTPSQKEAALAQAKQLTLDAILAGLDVWTAVKGRIRDSIHAQVLLEMAVVRLARMEELVSVGQLATTISQGGVMAVSPGAASSVRSGAARNEAADSSKKNGQVTVEPSLNGNASNGTESSLALSPSSLADVWERLKRYLGEKAPILANHLRVVSLPAISGPNSLAIRFGAEYNRAYEACDAEANIRRIEDGLAEILGGPVKVFCELLTQGSGAPGAATARPQQPVADRKKQLMNLPLFRKASQALGAQIWHVDDDFVPYVPQRDRPKPELETETDGDTNTEET